MIAQLSVYPIGEGTSLSRFVKKGVSVIEGSGYKYEIGGMSTAGTFATGWLFIKLILRELWKGKKF